MSEDLSDYQVTPEDLGCFGEKEIDDGVKEENVVEKKVLIPKSFESIPFAVKQRARKLYDTFEGDAKDMSFVDFCIELYALESPTLMKQDLAGIIEEKHNRNRRMAASLDNIHKHFN